MKSGLGTASLRVGNSGIVVGAIVAVNPSGDVVDPHTGSIVAGSRKADGSGFANTTEQILKGYGVRAQHGANTTIAVVATNAKFDKAGATKIAQMAHDGLARTISPIHTPYDGDAIFAACTGTSEATIELAAVGTIAAEVLAQAVLRAVRSATSLPGLPACRDLRTF
jgi:L-aminopeptidase/D-esterase-like protein